MPAYRFSWEPFDDRTVQALAVTLGYNSRAPTVSPCDWLTQACRRPDADFIVDTKQILEQYWLPQYGGLKHIVDRLIDVGIGPGGNPRSQSGYLEYVRRCRNSRTLREVLVQHLRRYGDQDRTVDSADGDDSDSVRRFAVVDPTDTHVKHDKREPYPYQKEAWERLSARMTESLSTGIFEGLLEMPTGSGKTFTAVHWLYREVIRHGGHVLWLAHRHELLNQAAREFYALADLASPLDRLRIRIVSGYHCAASQIYPGVDHILVCSIPILQRRPDIVDQIFNDPKLFMVVDEAHHSPASGLRNIIERLRARKRYRLLGITATPTRTNESQRPVLARLFGSQKIHTVSAKELIEQGYLSRPIPVRVSTNVLADDGMTTDDWKYLDQFDDFSKDQLARIAGLERRNQVIVQHYMEKRSTYGKTLIFAINVSHAALLTEALRQRGIAADYVASYRPDGNTSSSDEEILEHFRQPNGGLEALVNVQMLTEGVDVPGIQTIFLARPTMSETLLRQMIGRGLRGPKCGGTERAYIVSFEDHWNQFRDYLSPFELVRDITPPPPDPAPERERAERILGTIPWDLIRGVAAQIRSRGMAFQADAFEAVPHGWFLFERVVDEEQARHIVSVFEHQLPCWTEMLNHLSELNSTSLAQNAEAEEYDEYFSDCDDPRPPSHEIRQAIEHFRSGGGRPEYFEYTERKACDPRLIAAEIYDKDLGERSRTALIEQRYSMLAAAIYPSLFEFRVAVDDALQELNFPDASTRIVRGVPIFTPRPDQQLRPGPYHALDRLMIDVLERGRDLLQVQATLPMPSRLEWSKHIIKGWHGKAYWQDDDCPPPGRICINKLLDSPNLSEATLRFLLWHEYLHLYLKGLHTPTFRRLERLWPDCTQCERELDTLAEQFEIAYW